MSLGGGALLPLAAQAKPPGPIAPPVAQQSADCARPSYATDQLVCSTPQLAALDRTMARMIADLPSKPYSVDQPWLETQEAWFKRRSLCAFDKRHLACARDAYRTRIAELGALASHADGGSEPLRCPLLPEAVRYDRTGSGLLVIREKAGQAIVLAWPSGTAGWRPFISYRWEKAKLRLARQDGKATLSCQ